MELKLKNFPIGRTAEEQTEAIAKNLNRLEKLKELQEQIKDLSDEELLKLVAINYSLELNEEDKKAMVKTILQSEDIIQARLKTTIVKQDTRHSIGPIWDEWYDTWEHDALVYCAKENEDKLDYNHFYAKKELDILIASNIIIFGEFVPERYSSTYDKYSDNITSRYKAFTPLRDISLTNPSVFIRLIASNIRNILNEDSITNDICQSIDDIKERILMYQKSILNSIASHERALTELREENSSCLNNLDRLAKDKQVLERKRKA
ncbi:MAG: hypothetical protein NC483_06290 [Ruminococcus sp.]|nr:hypothetical protein [Ruminococcus sp.]